MQNRDVMLKLNTLTLQLLNYDFPTTVACIKQTCILVIVIVFMFLVIICFLILGNFLIIISIS